MRRHFADAEQDAGHETRSVETVGADGELLPRIAEQHLLVRNETA